MRSNSSVRAHRTLHLIDADNLLGDPRTVDRDVIDATFAEYRRVARFIEGDLVIVATGVNGLHVLEVERAWPTVQHRRRARPAGADHELLEGASWAASSGRLDRVVIGSGDRIFLLALDMLLAAGIDVEVVCRQRSLARALAAGAYGRLRYMWVDPVRPGSGRRPTECVVPRMPNETLAPTGARGSGSRRSATPGRRAGTRRGQARTGTSAIALAIASSGSS